MENLAYEKDGKIYLGEFRKGNGAVAIMRVNNASESPEMMDFHYQQICEYNELQRRKQLQQ